MEEYDGIMFGWYPDRAELEFFESGNPLDTKHSFPITFYEVWRKDITAGEKKFSKLAVKKPKAGSKGSEHYVDKSVITGHMYEYKVRYGTKISRKSVCSDFTWEPVIEAVRPDPEYNMELKSGGIDQPEDIIVKWSSHPDNGILKLYPERLWSPGKIWDDYEDDEEEDPLNGLTLVSFSEDGVIWDDGTSPRVLNPGAVLYMKFTPQQNAVSDTYHVKVKYARFEEFYAEMNLTTGEVHTELDYDFYCY